MKLTQFSSFLILFAAFALTARAQAPIIDTQPQSRSVVVGASLSMSVTVSNVIRPQFQWRKDGVAVAGQTLAFFQFATATPGGRGSAPTFLAQLSDAGTYTVVVSVFAGSVTSNPAVITVTPAGGGGPAIVTQPASQTLDAGATTSFSIVANGSGLTYQWRKDGVAIGGATTAAFALSNLQPTDAGVYTVVVTNASGSVTSNGATLTVNAGVASRISNVSVRTTLAANQVLIVGFSVAGGAKPVLLRGVGPGLGAFGVAGTMPDPVLTLFEGTTQIERSDNWGGTTTLAEAFAAVGAFGLPTGSLDAALTRSVDGSRTAQISGSVGGGIIVEAYDAGAGNNPRLVNVSARNNVGTGADILIAGITISGTGPKNVLIRAVGPTLAAFGVPNALLDPKLEVYSGTTKINENDSWAPTLSTTFVSVGAFALTTGSKDAALVATLVPGGYTVQVSGADGGTGEALVEIYEVQP